MFFRLTWGQMLQQGRLMCAAGNVEMLVLKMTMMMSPSTPVGR